jgi:hypothetical protein
MSSWQDMITMSLLKNNNCRIRKKNLDMFAAYKITNFIFGFYKKKAIYFGTCKFFMYDILFPAIFQTFQIVLL